MAVTTSTAQRTTWLRGNVIANSETTWNVYGNNPAGGPSPGPDSNLLSSNCLFAPNGASASDNGGVRNDSDFFSEGDGPDANVKGVAPDYVNPSDAVDDNLRPNRCRDKYFGTMSLP